MTDTPNALPTRLRRVRLKDGTEYERAPQVPLSPARMEVYLRTLAETGVYAEAALAASPHSPHGAMRTFAGRRERDPEFAAACEAAMDLFRASVEREVRRRAIEGVDEPVYWGGRKVGDVRRYSDRLLSDLAKAKLPEFRERATVAHVGAVAVGHLDLSQVSPEAQRLLLQALDVEAARRAEVVNDAAAGAPSPAPGPLLGGATAAVVPPAGQGGDPDHALVGPARRAAEAAARDEDDHPDDVPCSDHVEEAEGES